MSAPSAQDSEQRAFAACQPALAARDLAGAARAAIGAAESFFRQAAAQADLKRQIDGLACGRGCSYCCHQLVGVTEAEIALVRQSVLQLAPERQARIAQDSAALRGRTADHSQAAWWAAKLPCPLLAEDGACLVHAERPLSCRAMNSADRSVCQSSFEGSPAQIPVLAAQHKIFGSAQAGLLRALVAAGRPRALVILGTSL